MHTHIESGSGFRKVLLAIQAEIQPLISFHDIYSSIIKCMSVINFWIVNSVTLRIHSVTDFVLYKIIFCLENNKQGSYFSASVCLMFDGKFFTPLPPSL